MYLFIYTYVYLFISSYNPLPMLSQVKVSYIPRLYPLKHFFS